MGTLLQFRAMPARHARTHAGTDATGAARIVIFPGVRIERHQEADPDLDLAHRLRDSAGRDSFEGIDGDRPRKSS